MLRSLRCYALLAAIAALMYLVNLGGPHLWDEDEAIFSQTAREMHERGDAVVPSFNGELFAHKPPMMFWLMAAAYEAFGTNEFAARFPSALFGIAAVLLTCRLGRLLFSPSAGFWSGIILASSLNFVVIARAATPDAFLIFFSTLAMLLFVESTAKARAVSGAASERNAPWAGQTAFFPSWSSYVLIYATMGLAVLTKGPIGVVLPTTVLGLFLLVMRAPSSTVAAGDGSRGHLRAFSHWLARVFAPRQFLATVWSMRPLTAIVVVSAVAAPWYVLVGMRTDGEFLVGFFGVHNFGRFLNAMENHRGPIFYYLVAMAAGFFPWSVLFGPNLVDVSRQLRRRDAWRPGYVLACSWIAVWVGFFSLAGTKLPSYIVPAYPALALVTGALVDRWLRDPGVVTLNWARAVWTTVALVGIGMAVALPIAGHVFLDGDWGLALVAVIPLVGAAIGWVCSERLRVRAAIATLATIGVVMAIAIFGVAADYVDEFRDTPRIAELIARRTPANETPEIGSFRYFRPSFVFYTGQRVNQFGTAAHVRAFFDAHPRDAFVLTSEEGYSELRKSLASDIVVVETHRRFLRPGQALLLGRASSPSATAARPVAPLQ